MSIIEEKLFHVLPELPEIEAKLHENPILGFTRDFPWDELTEKIRQIFNFDTVSIECDQPQWTDIEGFKEIQDLPLNAYGFEISGYKGNITCLFDKNKLISLLIHTFEQDISGLGQIDEDFQQALKTSFLLEICHTLENLGWVDQLCPILLGPVETPEPPQVVCRITAHLNEVHFPLVLLLSRNFVASWRQKHNSPCYNTNTESLKDITPLWCSLELAHIPFTYNELQAIDLGDIISIPSCQWDLKNKEGIVTISCANTSIAKATVSRTETKIQEILTYQEASTPMEPINETTAKAMEEDKKDPPATLDNDLTPQEKLPEEPEDKDNENPENLAPHDDSNEETSEQEQVTPGEYSKEEPLQVKKPQPEHEDIVQNISDINVNLVVELGRFKKPVKEILTMTPGDILKLGFKPEHTVDLMVNNQCIGRGEMLKIGETIGIRILEIAPRT